MTASARRSGGYQEKAASTLRLTPGPPPLWSVPPVQNSHTHPSIPTADPAHVRLLAGSDSWASFHVCADRGGDTTRLAPIRQSWVATSPCAHAASELD